MPSIIGHAFVGAALGSVPIKELPYSKKFLFLSILCADLPDFDVVFRFTGFDQGGLLGHRHISHSILFAMVVAPILAFLAYRKNSLKVRILISSCFFLLILSHGLLDALTLHYGVGLFYPFDHELFHFSYTPLLPSGFSLHDFTTNGAFQVELLYVWIPSVVLILTFRHFRIKRRTP